MSARTIVEQRRRNLRIARAVRCVLWAVIVLQVIVTGVLAVVGDAAAAVFFLIAVGFAVLDAVFLGPLVREMADGIEHEERRQAAPDDTSPEGQEKP